jgi:hypothetical protein
MGKNKNDDVLIDLQREGQTMEKTNQNDDVLIDLQKNGQTMEKKEGQTMELLAKVPKQAVAMSAARRYGTIFC